MKTSCQVTFGSGFNILPGTTAACHPEHDPNPGQRSHQSNPSDRRICSSGETRSLQPVFWTMIAGCFFVPFVLLLFAVIRRSVLAMCLIAISINLGIWLNKYLMIVLVYSPDNRPFNHWIDIALAPLAGFLMTVLQG